LGHLPGTGRISDSANKEDARKVIHDLQKRTFEQTASKLNHV
jgi:hypothetical protein